MKESCQHESAFPTSLDSSSLGLTKREWFAGMAIQWYSHPSQWSSQATLIAERAFELADAMIEASKI